jgi:hypothetical protein
MTPPQPPRHVPTTRRYYNILIGSGSAGLGLKHPIELDRDTFLKRTLAMELLELDELQQAFRDKALVDRDVASATLLVKVAERRATLLGMNAPDS